MQSTRLQRKLVSTLTLIAAFAISFVCLIVEAGGQDLAKEDPPQKGSSAKADTISIAEAQALVAKSTIKLGLDLDRRVTQIDKKLAKVLSKSNGLLSLNGLRTLDLESAEALTSGDLSGLRLNGLVQISPEVAKVISQTGYLELNALKPDLTVYQAFENRKGRLLLNGIEEIDMQAAKALTKARYPLDLNGVKAMSMDVVAVFSESEIQLSLEGIKELSEEAQQLFSKRKGIVVFQALGTITNPQFAAKIAGQPFNVNLPSVERINPEVLANLAISKQHLTLGLRSLNADQATSLKSCTCSVAFPKITALDSDVIDILLKSSARFELPSLESLEDTRFAERLSRDASGFLSLRVDSLNEDIAAKITSKKTVLFLPNLQALEPGVAKILAAHKGRLILSGLRSMSDQDAEWFSRRVEYLLLPESITTSEQAKATLKANERISWRTR